ncbi:UNVERIFIED_CONTAM: hypothetical protein Cloal_0382 [Acetivibrio alkalicellulosi]
MKKNLLRTCIGLAVGGSLLITSTIMTMATGPSGYETLKAVIKNSNNMENATFNISGSLKDNNEELIKIDSLIKMSEQDHLASGKISITTDMIDKNYTFYKAEDKMILKDDDSNVYNQFTCNKEFKEKKFCKKDSQVKKCDNPQMSAIGETIIDTLVGDFKRHVTLTNIGNNEKQIGINLDKNEIPSLLNLILSAKCQSKYQNECENKDKMFQILGIDPENYQVPKLTSNITVEKIGVQIIVDQNDTIKEMDLELNVTGNDAQNQFRNQNFKLTIVISDVNSTIVDIIDLNGREVNEILLDEFSCNSY